MKNTDNQSKPATKSDLRSEISRLEKSIGEKFATKDDLRKEIEGVDVRMDLKFEEFERRAKQREQNYHSQVMTSFDKVMKRLDDIDHNIEVGNQTEEKLKDHEKRLKRLEKVRQN